MPAAQKSAALLWLARLLWALKAFSETAAKTLHGSDYSDKLYSCCVSELKYFYRVWSVDSSVRFNSVPEPLYCFTDGVSSWPCILLCLCDLLCLCAATELAMAIVLSAPVAAAQKLSPPLVLPFCYSWPGFTGTTGCAGIFNDSLVISSSNITASFSLSVHVPFCNILLNLLVCLSASVCPH